MSKPEEKNPIHALDGKEKELRISLIRILSETYATGMLKLSNTELIQEIESIIKQMDILFVSKALLYLRFNYSMRNITNYFAVVISEDISGEKWAKDFYNKIVITPDDMMEIAGMLVRNGGKIPNSVKKGFQMAFKRFDSYQLLKYTRKRNGFDMQDLIKLVHPKSIKGNTLGLSRAMSNAVDIETITMDEEEILKRINNIGLE